MPVFNFDGSTASFDDTGTSVANATGTITDATPTPVSFTLSVFGNTGGSNVSVQVADTPGAGFGIVGTTSGGATLSAVTVIFGLASTTPSRTGFGVPSNPVIQVNGGSVAGIQINGGAQILFSLSGSTNYTISTLTTGFTCFCAGTRIATPSGEKAVEDLQAGDIVRLADGRDTPVRWLGRQPVDMTLSNPAEANPIRITRGALGGGLPERDLRVSPDHAICIDGLLINAGALVNGSTIYQERDVTEDFTYYHVETDAHELILAEGVAAETFIDYTTRDTFENADEAPERIIPEMALPRISSARLVPEPIKRRLRPAIAAE